MYVNLILNGLNSSYCEGLTGAKFYNALREFVKMFSGDRRYQLYVLASTTNNTSMILEYRKQKYYFYYDYSAKCFKYEK